MALHYSLTSSQIPAGVIALSSYLFRSTPLLNFRKLPICLMHGDRDDVIKESEAVESYQRILQDQNLVSYQTIKNLDHSLNLRELAMMKLWFQDVNGFIEKHYKTK